MKTLSEMPKRLFIQRTQIQTQLGIRPAYTVEVISTRTIKRKCIEVLSDVNGFINAPSGYRISRVWEGQPSTASEIQIDA